MIRRLLEKMGLAEKKPRWRWPDEANATGLRWEAAFETREDRMNGWTAGCATGEVYVQYFCEECNGKLTPGPSGGGTNQVCEACRINYGCLPGGLQR